MLENHVADHDLISYLDGELDASQAARVEFHFALCEQCRLRAKELEEQLRFLSPRSSSGEVSMARVRSWQRAFATRTRMHEAAREPICRSGRLHGAARFLVVAASLLVITSAAMLFNERRESRKRQDHTYAQTLESSAKRLASIASMQRYSHEIVQASPIRRKIAGQLTVWADPQRQRSSIRVDSEAGVLRYASWHPDAIST